MPIKALRATAYHEAGHAVISLIERHHVRRVSIIPNEEDGSLGHCGYNRPPKWFSPDAAMGFREEKWIQSKILIGLAGMTAERRLIGRRNRIGASQDLDAAVDLARYLYRGRCLELFLAFMVERTTIAVAAPATWLRIEAVAQALLDREVLSGREVREVCWNAMASRLPVSKASPPAPEDERPARRTRRA